MTIEKPGASSSGFCVRGDSGLLFEISNRCYAFSDFFCAFLFSGELTEKVDISDLEISDRFIADIRFDGITSPSAFRDVFPNSEA